MLNVQVTVTVRTSTTRLLAAWILLRACYLGDYEIACQVSQDGTDDPVSSIHHQLDPDQPLSALLSAIRDSCGERLLPQQQQADSDKNDGVVVDARLQEQDDTAEPRGELASAVRLDTLANYTALDVLEDLEILHEKTPSQIAEDLRHVLVQILDATSDARTVSSISFATESEASTVWTWNATVPERFDECVHTLVGAAIRRNPQAPALDAHDGLVTYGQLDAMATALAQSLVLAGLSPRQAVPLCFEKSKWTPIAILAVMRAGGTCITLDIHQPSERLQTIVQQVQPRLVLCSTQQQPLAATIAPTSRIMVPEQQQLEHKLEQQLAPPALPQVDPAWPLYIVFTSGSTGTPKGVVISHANFASAVKHQQTPLGITAQSRIYDFVSYAFDVSWSNVLHALTAGACLCIPSDDDRQNNIAVSVRDMRVNYAHITPTVGRLMLAQAPDLTIDQVAFIGEPLLASDVAQWAGRARTLNTYGPAEATPVSTVAEMRAPLSGDPGIGRPVGCNAWVVGRVGAGLAPIGAAGELVIEGPIVGQGYLDDAAKTAASFVRDPAWLAQGSRRQPGRRGTLYRTGDMVRFQADGRLVFVGRRDGQIKIRGQRVELGDMESHLHDVVAPLGMAQSAIEAAAPRGSETKILAAFLRGPADAVAEVAGRATAALCRRLPPYMVPQAWLPLDDMPMTPSGKLDRRRLRALVGAQTLPQLLAGGGGAAPATMRAPRTATETTLQQLWAQVTGVAAGLIGRDSNLMCLGGDSMKAMQLVTAARARGLRLTAADAMQTASLAAMATMCVPVDATTATTSMEPFGAWSERAVDVRHRIARLCGVADDAVEDAFFCTPLQEGMLALTARRPLAFRSTHVWELRPSVCLKQLGEAWQRTQRRIPILRTQIVDIGEPRFVQAVLAEPAAPIPVVHGNLQRHLAADDAEPLGLATSLQRLCVVVDPQPLLVLRLHHSLYDGLSLPMVLEQLEAAYHDCEPPRALADFRLFAAHVTQPELAAAAASFWETHLEGMAADAFPPLPWPGCEPVADAVAEHRVERMPWPVSRYTPTALIRAAWALVQDQHTGARGDVLFANVVTGRQAAVAGVESMCGPTMATVPMRVQLPAHGSAAELVERVQAAGLAAVPHEQIGLQHLKKVSAACARGCDFQTLLLVQPERQYTALQASRLLQRTLVDDEQNTVTGEAMLGRFNPVALLWQFHLRPHGLRLRASFDSRVLSLAQVESLAAQLEHNLGQLCRALQPGAPAVALARMGSMGGGRPELWQRNHKVPPQPAAVDTTPAQPGAPPAALVGPRDAAEAQLQGLLATVLGMGEASAVDLDQPFVRLGGDSLSAMRLVAAARQDRVAFSVGQVFSTPSMRHLATATQAADVGELDVDELDELNEVPAFSLVPSHDAAALRQLAAQACGLEAAQVEDVLPCTALQEGLLALSLRYPDKYVSRDILTLREHVDVERLQQAWAAVERALPILRTRLADLEGLGLVQVVASPDNTAPWTRASRAVEGYVDADAQEAMRPGQRLMRLALVEDEAGTHVVWTMHHALYDLWTMPAILQRVDEAYRGQPSPRAVPFAQFVAHTTRLDASAMASFWRGYLDGAQHETFPPAGDEPRPDQSYACTFRGVDWSQIDATPATVVRAAWGVLIAQHTNAADGVFGALSSGRQAGMAGMERVAGPTIATVPVRVHVGDAPTVGALLQRVQREALAAAAWEQMGLRRIRQLGPAAEAACRFQSLLVVQPPLDAPARASGVFQATRGLQDAADGGLGRGYGAFNVYALMLVVAVEGRDVAVRASFDAAVIGAARVRRLLSQLEHLVRQLGHAAHQHQRLPAVCTLSPVDAAAVARWNAPALPPVAGVVHELVGAAAQRHQHTVAVDAWDGRFAYGELVAQARRLARLLRAHGVVAGQQVPLVAHKSRWTPVAMLGVMQAGAVAVLLDAEQPLEHLALLVAQLQPPRGVMVCGSAATARLARQLDADGALLMAWDETAQAVSLPAVRPDDAAYVSFTSGSTGTPKGVVISHGNIAAAVAYQREATGLGAGQRVYDFASYSFDAAWFNALHTLAHGGTLCIPSSDERRNDLEASVARFGATAAVLTPSTARLLDPARVPRLQRLMLVGEASDAGDLARWAGVAQLRVGYGPAETTIMATVCSPARRPGRIGAGTGARCWVADPRHPTMLAPVGAVGELWIEGPLVGRGYLGGAAAAAADAAFAARMPWSQGRVYRTGDLVRYDDDDDGTLEFVGRGDRQVKLRGQRLELAAVEHHVARELHGAPVAAEVVAGRLLVFVEAPAVDAPALLRRLRVRLPPHEVPAACVAVARLPATPSGKIDRRALRARGALLPLADAARGAQQQQQHKEPPSTPRQRLLRALWAAVLGRDEAAIGAHDDFLQLGGDSIAAMRLASLARRHALALRVADVFDHPRLDRLAACLADADADSDSTYAPFSLVGGAAARVDIARRCGVADDAVEDALPCTPLQEGMLALTARRPRDYVASHVLRLRPRIAPAAVEAACARLVDATPILRTRIVESPSLGLLQAVLRPASAAAACVAWPSLAAYHNRDPAPMGLGSPLHAWGLVTDPDSAASVLVWDLHHALYDGFAFPLLLQRLEAALLDALLPPAPPFQAFVQHALANNASPAAAAFWTSQLQDLDAPVWPALPFSTYQPRASAQVRHRITSINWPTTGITPSSALRAAWALAIARLTDADDVVFGAVVSGRQAAVPRIDEILGPTIATVPVRVRLDPGACSVASFLAAIQAQAAAMVPFEQLGIQHIQKLGPDAAAACSFQSLLVVQPPPDSPVASSSVFDPRTPLDTDDALFNSYALMLHCQLLQDRQLALVVDFDPNIVPSHHASRLAAQFDAILRRLCDSANQATLVRDIPATCDQDMADIWAWNKAVPPTVDRCVHDVIADMTRLQPDALAIDAWDGQLTYAQLARQSDRFARYLVRDCGLERGDVVPLCFEKSVWMAVAVHGVMKAGGASISMDATQPEQRLRAIVEQARPRLLIASCDKEPLARRLAPCSDSPLHIAVPQLVLSSSSTASPDTLADATLPRVSPSDKLYVVFTSGSTGVPKGVVVCHSSFASASLHQQHLMRVGPGSRVYDFVSYSFDFAWSNALNTLCRGGCLCVPSEHDRKSNLNASLRATRTTFVHLTASVVKVLDLSQLPHLEALALGGERMDKAWIRAWDPTKRLLNFYGPAECAQTVSITDFAPATADPSDIGRSAGVNSWLVEPANPGQLAMVGAVAELCLEGPMLAQGYLSERDTASRGSPFDADPAWLVSGNPNAAVAAAGRRGKIYRTGDLVRYNADGSLVFVGRKDGRVKIRGQRVELSEVEHHTKNLIQARGGSGVDVVAELITPRIASNNNNGQASGAPMLVAFLSGGAGGQTSNAQLQDMALGLDEALSSLVPTYMVPAMFIPITAIPLGGTGKVDRKKLRAFGSDMTLEELAALNPLRATSSAPATDAEKDMAAVWADLLKINLDTIRAQDNFFRIGGDSIGAMRLVGWLARRNQQVTVAEIFATPRLDELVKVVRLVSPDACSPSALKKPVPGRFSLLKKKMASSRDSR